MRQRTSILWIAILLAPAPAAADTPRLGAAGAQELRIPVGPRGTALSGAVVADASGVEAIYWNPAGIAAGDEPEILFSTMSYLVDSRVHFVGVTHRFGELGTLGFSAKALSVGDIPVTTEAAGGPTGETFAPASSVIGVSFARRLPSPVSAGVSGHVVHESIRNASATGVAFDVGFQFDPGWRGVRVGAVVKSLGPKMGFEGSDFGSVLEFPDADPSAAPRPVSTESASFELPATFQVGVSVDAFRDERSRLAIASAFQSNSFAENEQRFGAEYTWNEQLVLRGGATLSAQDDYVWGFTYGGGVHASLGDWGVHVDYARQSTSEFFGEQDLISIRMRF